MWGITRVWQAAAFGSLILLTFQVLAKPVGSPNPVPVDSVGLPTASYPTFTFGLTRELQDCFTAFQFTPNYYFPFLDALMMIRRPLR